MKLFSAGVIAMMICSCSTLSNTGSSEVVLFNPVMSAGALTVSVMSNGCTKADHFDLIVSEEQVELRRTVEDLCRSAPQLVSFKFAYEFGYLINPRGEAVYRYKNEVRYGNRVIR